MILKYVELINKGPVDAKAKNHARQWISGSRHVVGIEGKPAASQVGGMEVFQPQKAFEGTNAKMQESV